MKIYKAPQILDSATLALEADLLAGSIADSVGVETAGQQTDGFYDTIGNAESTFNHHWED